MPNLSRRVDAVRHAFTSAALGASVATALATPFAHAGSVPIFMDGRFNDWSAVLLAAEDESGDGGASGIDFGRVWVANDGRHLFLRVQLGSEIVMQEDNDLTLYVDTDDDAGTGTQLAGMGADLVWSFGDRDGSYAGSSIFWDDVGVISAPSFGSDEFEISLLRDAAPGGTALFPSSTIRLAFRDASSGGDWVPSASHVTYAFDDADPLDPPVIGLDRDDPGYVRVVTYNVLWDGLWDRPDEHERMIQAIQPDIVAYQEIGNHTGNETRQWVENALGGAWNVDWSGELQLLTPYPILGGWNTGEGRARATLVDLPATFDHDLLVINVHLKCCSNGDALRQEQIDDVMSFVRDGLTSGGTYTLAPDTPIMIVGDTNMYGDPRQVETLLTGDILDNGTYGPDFAPDWDGGNLDALISRHPAVRQSFTWYNEFSSYQPSHIDRVTVTGSVLNVAKSYVLHTPLIPPAALAGAGLLADDSVEASDHAPHVVDLSPTAIVATADPGAVAGVRHLLASPSPFRSRTQLHFTLARADVVHAAIFDASGRLVADLGERRLPAGPHVLRWQVPPGPSAGTYFARVRSGDGVQTARLVVLR